MPLVTCPDCKTEVSTDAAACPRCGRRKRRPLPLFRIVLVLFLLIAGAWAVKTVSDYETRAKPRAY